MPDKIKPCPFCGRRGEVKQLQFGFETVPRFGVVCITCGISPGWYFEEAEAVRAWNRRDGRDEDA